MPSFRNIRENFDKEFSTKDTWLPSRQYSGKGRLKKGRRHQQVNNIAALFEAAHDNYEQHSAEDPVAAFPGRVDQTYTQEQLGKARMYAAVLVANQIPAAEDAVGQTYMRSKMHKAAAGATESKSELRNRTSALLQSRQILDQADLSVLAQNNPAFAHQIEVETERALLLELLQDMDATLSSNLEGADLEAARNVLFDGLDPAIRALATGDLSQDNLNALYALDDPGAAVNTLITRFATMAVTHKAGDTHLNVKHPEDMDVMRQKSAALLKGVRERVPKVLDQKRAFIDALKALDAQLVNAVPHEVLTSTRQGYFGSLLTGIDPAVLAADVPLAFDNLEGIRFRDDYGYQQSIDTVINRIKANVHAEELDMETSVLDAIHADFKANMPAQDGQPEIAIIAPENRQDLTVAVGITQLHTFASSVRAAYQNYRDKAGAGPQGKKWGAKARRPYSTKSSRAGFVTNMIGGDARHPSIIDTAVADRDPKHLLWGLAKQHMALGSEFEDPDKRSNSKLYRTQEKLFDEAEKHFPGEVRDIREVMDVHLVAQQAKTEIDSYLKTTKEGKTDPARLAAAEAIHRSVYDLLEFIEHEDFDPTDEVYVSTLRREYQALMIAMDEGRRLTKGDTTSKLRDATKKVMKSNDAMVEKYRDKAGDQRSKVVMPAFTGLVAADAFTALKTKARSALDAISSKSGSPLKKRTYESVREAGRNAIRRLDEFVAALNNPDLRLTPREKVDHLEAFLNHAGDAPYVMQEPIQVALGADPVAPRTLNFATPAQALKEVDASTKAEFNQVVTDFKAQWEPTLTAMRPGVVGAAEPELSAEAAKTAQAAMQRF